MGREMKGGAMPGSREASVGNVLKSMGAHQSEMEITRLLVLNKRQERKKYKWTKHSNWGGVV